MSSLDCAITLWTLGTFSTAWVLATCFYPTRRFFTHVYATMSVWWLWYCLGGPFHSTLGTLHLHTVQMPKNEIIFSSSSGLLLSGWRQRLRLRLRHELGLHSNLLTCGKVLSHTFLVVFFVCYLAWSLHCTLWFSPVYAFAYACVNVFILSLPFSLIVAMMFKRATRVYMHMCLLQLRFYFSLARAHASFRCSTFMSWASA